MKEAFLEIYEAFIDRPGCDKLLEFLNASDFFTAPASTRFHLSEQGGLCKHSLNVYNRLVRLVELEYGENWEDKYSHETIALCGLLHDVCKINMYKVEFKTFKDLNGNWTKKPYYVIDEDLPFGHGEKSVYIINGFIRLTRQEAIAINWHMGGFDDRIKGSGAGALANAYYKYPLALLLHLADVQAAYLDEQLPPK
ncbi:MAG: HD domain-containing protein [Christensenellaceae bacterium]|jgi:hypothetical protein|nr:HD domain-containing protein [Christensenellaceae bacterium]